MKTKTRLTNVHGTYDEQTKPPPQIVIEFTNFITKIIPQKKSSIIIFKKRHFYLFCIIVSSQILFFNFFF